MVCACFYDENDNFRNKLWVLTSYDASRKEEVNTLKEYISSREDFCICSDDLFEKNKVKDYQEFLFELGIDYDLFEKEIDDTKYIFISYPQKRFL